MERWWPASYAYGMEVLGRPRTSMVWRWPGAGVWCSDVLEVSVISLSGALAFGGGILVAGVRREAFNWLVEAEADLERARRALRDGDYALASFMAQQACEKALKAAYIGLARRQYPRTHDLVALYEGLRGLVRLPADTAEMLAEVSQYYLTARYPSAGLELPSRSIRRFQAERAIRVAEVVVREVASRIRG